MGVQWTKEQQEVIRLRDRNILVSAAAGSGKTAVLVERILSKITDKEHPVDIDRLLIMTFTRAAAGEMKERISAAIEKALCEDPDNEHLQRQTTLLHTAQITTIDGFCAYIIRNYFHLIGLDPGYRTADEGELKLLRGDVVKALLEEYYAGKDEKFQKFVECFATGKSDENLGNLIQKLYEMAMSNPFPQEWLSGCMDDYRIDSLEELRETEWMLSLIHISAALGRLLTAGAMMGTMMKGDKDILTLQIKAGGPLEGITVTADSKGRVKGYVGNPDVCIPANSKGKLDVAGAVGVGFMNVIKDMGLKEPYVGQVALQTSEIAEDLTYYFATSEQVPSAVGLGVLMNKDNTVRQAGGFIVQLMPFAEESTIAKLEENVQKITSVTNLLEEGHTPESLLEKVLEGFDMEINEKVPTEFYCNCSRERVEKALISIGRKELNEMIQEGKSIEMNCHFCNKNYEFTVEELKEILRKCK